MYPGYSEHISVRLGTETFVIATNTYAEYPYMVYTVSRAQGDSEVNKDCVAGDDYLDVFHLFVTRLAMHLEFLDAESALQQNGHTMLTAADCIPDGLKQDLKGELIVIKPECLLPEYQTALYQLRLGVGGFGCNPDARGSAVICQNLIDRGVSRFERSDIAGIIDPAKTPQWALDKLSARQPSDTTQD